MTRAKPTSPEYVRELRMACTEPQKADSGGAFGFVLDSPNFAHLRPESGQLMSMSC
jgi:hypothetical protein